MYRQNFPINLILEVNELTVFLIVQHTYNVHWINIIIDMIKPTISTTLMIFVDEHCQHQQYDIVQQEHQPLMTRENIWIVTIDKICPQEEDSPSSTKFGPQSSTFLFNCVV